MGGWVFDLSSARLKLNVAFEICRVSSGLGGVRYVPEGWEELLTDQAKEELNSLNMSLVDSLRATDAAFSLGEGSDGLVCVRYGYCRMSLF